MSDRPYRDGKPSTARYAGRMTGMSGEIENDNDGNDADCASAEDIDRGFKLVETPRSLNEIDLGLAPDPDYVPHRKGPMYFRDQRY